MVVAWLWPGEIVLRICIRIHFRDDWCCQGMSGIVTAKEEYLIWLSMIDAPFTVYGRSRPASFLLGPTRAKTRAAIWTSLSLRGLSDAWLSHLVELTCTGSGQGLFHSYECWSPSVALLIRKPRYGSQTEGATRIGSLAPGGVMHLSLVKL